MKTIPSTKAIYTFVPDLRPVERARPGETVCFDALDALGGQVQVETDVLSGLDFERINPASGPLCVDGTQAGDTLAVHVIAIDMADQGAIVTGPGLGVLGDEVEHHATRILPIRDGRVGFGDLWIPAEPMIGVIGVAPASGAFATGTAHRHGGNMDTREIGIGSVLYLPVSQPGAMLAMGDVHAVMGDGEVCVSACEVAARVTVRVDRIAGRCRDWPVVETARAVHILVSLPTIEEALVEATRQAVGFVQAARGICREDAYMLCSLCVDIGISQLVDPNKTAKASIPKYILPKPASELL